MFSRATKHVPRLPNVAIDSKANTGAFPSRPYIALTDALYPYLV